MELVFKYRDQNISDIKTYKWEPKSESISPCSPAKEVTLLLATTNKNIMPRSNKKKRLLTPQPTHPTSQQMETMDTGKTIVNLMSDERSRMISRAICSAHYHQINLKPGSPIPGFGDCAFEAAIQNINERNCYKKKFPLPITSYRQYFVTDMANRTVNTEWNIHSHSPQEWLSGWQEILIPGTYERGVFGDLMLPGIACGVQKYLLIFNTSTNSPHDPIYVVDPRKFDVQPDTDIPIVIAYNQVIFLMIRHY